MTVAPETQPETQIVRESTGAPTVWPRVPPEFETIAATPPSTESPPDIGRTPEHFDQWAQRLCLAGIAAQRRTSPDLVAQLAQVPNRPIDTIVCNILDGDPALRLHATLAARFPDALVAGIKLLAELTTARRSFLVTDHTSPSSWIAPLRLAARPAKLRLVGLRNDYPQSDPTLVLYTLLNRRLKPAELPTECRVLMLDAAAAVAVGQVVLEGRARNFTPVAVHDHAARRSHYLLLPIGTRLSDLLARLSLTKPGTILRLADPLRDLRVSGSFALDHGELTIHAMPPERPINPSPCIRCTWCVEGCPTRVQPAGLLEAAQHSDPRLAKKFGIHACIECGICSYVCPSQLPLLPAIRELKKLLVASK